ncbi:MAG: HAD-IIIC family phosphatase [Candidatus Omnitrophica bacterium]|nr:HAD-IIIC family phosphatase [Candidatus Omnitrophota bacterium]
MEKIKLEDILVSLERIIRPGDFTYQFLQGIEMDAPLVGNFISKLCEIQAMRKEPTVKKEIEDSLLKIFNFLYEWNQSIAFEMENVVCSKREWEENNLFLLAEINKAKKNFLKAIHYFELLFRKSYLYKYNKEALFSFTQCVLDSNDENLLRKTFRFISGFINDEIDYVTALTFSQLFREMVRRLPISDRIKIKLAILGSFTTTQIVPVLELFCLKENIYPEIYEAPFNQYEQEIINSNSSLYNFKPDIVIFAVTYRDIFEYPQISDENSMVLDKVNRTVERWISLWRLCRDKLGTVIIQHNFDIPEEDYFGNISRVLYQARRSFLHKVNIALAEAVKEGVILLDFDHISALFGKRRWFSNKYWYFSKQAFNLDAIPLLCSHYVATVKAIKGLAKKCLILDLDNTLWGGVVADEGVEEIKIGQGDPIGEAFQDFQRYLKQLKERGVILCVVSKNNESIAKEPFVKRKEMILGLEDFAVFIANWEDKAQNIKRISKILNLGLDSFVFIDDSPVEREMVRQSLPAVCVPELPNEPCEYRSFLDRQLYFEMAFYSKEDLNRTQFYQANLKREELKEQMPDLITFYKSLEMIANILPFSLSKLGRITQLVNKTNQFNLTTKRYSEVQLKEFMENPNIGSFYLELKDKFGDNGLVSIMIIRIENEEAFIDTWLMSCRVFGRTVENTFLDFVVNWLKEKRVKKIKGQYIPTQKNGYVKDLYVKMGFKKVKEFENGESFWEEEIDKLNIPDVGFIRVVTEDIK